MPSPTQTTDTVLDHIDNITVPGNVFAEPANEYWALLCLRDGMEWLYRQALRCDHIAKQQVNPTGNVHFVGSGSFPAFRRVPTTLLTCAFHWYAIAACQYVRTVGAIAHQHHNNRPLPGAYAQTVIPEVLAFRDKVAAHFAWPTRNNRDNDAERLASILPPLTFEDDSFFVGALAVAVRRGGKRSNSKAIKPWSICKVHEGLRERYWPAQDDNQKTSRDPNAV